ncbi:hypothetical protein TNIN_390091 [Trichonephila inaurata madagascariensis]|uniref:Uncharacterized protein n=1 Tax=Trichonephila inaurata madagascariensis TaxID=2747483 RepID=A0A8X7CIC5_9ARAC|nr:hypothetical protein TNIN_390091 [Trichonephila inaurata madagascariensis]
MIFLIVVTNPLFIINNNLTQTCFRAATLNLLFLPLGFIRMVRNILAFEPFLWFGGAMKLLIPKIQKILLALHSIMPPILRLHAFLAFKSRSLSFGSNSSLLNRFKSHFEMHRAAFGSLWYACKI